jgi:mycothiol synthase
MSSSLTGYDIRQISLPELTDAEIEPVVALVNVIRAERRPRSVEFSGDEFRVFATSPGSVRRHHLVTDSEGAPAAYLNLSYPDDGTNPSLLKVSIGVLPEHRRMGIATEMLSRAVQAGRELGRITLAGEIFDTVPGAARFIEAIGARKTLDLHHNVVRIADLDLEMLQRWQREGPDRAPGYSVMVVEGMYPDDLLEGMAHLYLVLERDAPMPEGWEPRNWTGGFVKSWLENFLNSVDAMTAIAVEDASGTPVGMSQIGRRRSDETTWFVTTTMVDPEHRGRALGKWVKAAACLEALQRWPGAVWMETGNAFTNEPMLGINHAMGFRHEFTMSEVEVGVEDAEAYLAARPV